MNTELQIAVAERLGWYVIQPPPEDGSCAFALREPDRLATHQWCGTKQEAWSCGPNYPESRDACAEIYGYLQASTQSVRDAFAVELLKLKGWIEGCDGDLSPNDLLSLLSCPPDLQCQAFLEATKSVEAK